MYSINENHFLEGDGVECLPCPKNQEKFSSLLPDTIVLHYTAGTNAESSARYLVKDSVKASAHIVIGRDGKVWQLVPFNTIAWHAGVSEYGNRKGYNKYSIGIELDNPGYLEKVGDEFLSVATGRKYQAKDVIEKTHRNEQSSRYWLTYTEAQISACREICETLIQKYNISLVLGHEEIAPGRKLDPGPAFPLDKFRELLLSHDRAHDDEDLNDRTGLVSASQLNIRVGAGINFDKLPLQLTQGALLHIQQEHDGWYKIQMEVNGWVSAEHIQIK